MSNTCNFILLRGNRKGEKCSLPCSKLKYCSRHNKMISRPRYFDFLYTDLIWVLIGFLEPLDLWSFSIINKDFNITMAGSRFSSIWNKAIEQTKISYSIPSTINLPKDRIFSLLSFIGCEICHKQRIRKIYWEFGIRVCHNCLEKITISDYRLKHDYNINSEIIHKLPSISRTLWARYVGTYSLDFYLIKDIERVIGKTLESVLAEKTYKLSIINNLLASFDALVRRTFSSVSIAKSCESYKLLIGKIKSGSIESINEIELNHIDKFSDEYDELQMAVKLKAKERRDKKKRITTTLEEILNAETINDIMEIESIPENDEISNALKLRLLNEINSLNKNDETFDSKINIILQIPTIKRMTDIDKEKIIHAVNYKRNPEVFNTKTKKWINKSEVYCGICKTDRRFKMAGLEQHSHALHQGQIIALNEFIEIF